MTWQALSVSPYEAAELHRRRVALHQLLGMALCAVAAGAYTRPHFSSTSAILVTPPRAPLSNRQGGNHAPNVSHKMCLR
jgi:uncharacterized protein involved in exopolysaccharide biosynthesis